MPRINKLQKYAICWLSYIGKTNQEIAEEIDITEKQIADTLEKNKSNIPNNIGTNTSPVVSKNKMKNLMINQTIGKKTNMVSIMTKEASEIADAEKGRSITKNRFTENSIFRPNK